MMSEAHSHQKVKNTLYAETMFITQYIIKHMSTITICNQQSQLLYHCQINVEKINGHLKYDINFLLLLIFYYHIFSVECVFEVSDLHYCNPQNSF